MAQLVWSALLCAHFARAVASVHRLAVCWPTRKAHAGARKRQFRQHPKTILSCDAGKYSHGAGPGSGHHQDGDIFGGVEHLLGNPAHEKLLETRHSLTADHDQIVPFFDFRQNATGHLATLAGTVKMGLI